MKVLDVVDFLEKKYPQDNSSDFDKGKIGLIFGSVNNNCHNILLSLDLNLEVVEECISKECNLIIIHHPYLFNPISKINFDSEMGKVISKLIKYNISVFAMHTNYDCSINGVNDSLAKRLFIQDVKYIKNESMKDCFLRYGLLKNEMKLKDLVYLVKERFQLNSVKVVGNLSKTVSKIGIVGGSGSDYYDVNLAISKKCDVYISAEFSLHVAQYALKEGLCLIDINHGVEKFAFDDLKNYIIEEFNQLDKRVFISDINTDPLISL